MGWDRAQFRGGKSARVAGVTDVGGVETGEGRLATSAWQVM